MPLDAALHLVVADRRVDGRVLDDLATAVDLAVARLPPAVALKCREECRPALVVEPLRGPIGGVHQVAGHEDGVDLTELLGDRPGGELEVGRRIDLCLMIGGQHDHRRLTGHERPAETEGSRPGQLIAPDADDAVRLTLGSGHGDGGVVTEDVARDDARGRLLVDGQLRRGILGDPRELDGFRREHRDAGSTAPRDGVP